VARRGAAVVRHGPNPDGPSASEVWRETVARTGAVRDWEPDERWVIDEDTTPGGSSPGGSSPGGGRRSARGVPQERDQAVGEGTAPGGHRHSVPGPVVAELADAAGSMRGQRLAARLADATYAYDRERFAEARRILRPLADEVPEAAAVRELYGLVLYRLGEWLPATRHLEAYRSATGSFDQHPVLADCYRALHRYGDAEALWDDLRQASPDGDLVAEGRIVAAGCRADQGDLAGAIALLERAAKRVEHPKDRHLRQWYTLGDLYERAGDLPRARELFARIVTADADAFDVRQRLRGLR
jgi:predicted Zn-dependent protease